MFPLTEDRHFPESLKKQQSSKIRNFQNRITLATNTADLRGSVRIYSTSSALIKEDRVQDLEMRRFVSVKSSHQPPATRSANFR